MDGQKRSKSSRVVGKCREYVRFAYKEVKYAIPKGRLNMTVLSTQIVPEETRKKRLRIIHFHFNLNCIKTKEKESKINERRTIFTLITKIQTYHHVLGVL